MGTALAQPGTSTHKQPVLPEPSPGMPLTQSQGLVSRAVKTQGQLKGDSVVWIASLKKQNKIKDPKLKLIMRAMKNLNTSLNSKTIPNCVFTAKCSMLTFPAFNFGQMRAPKPTHPSGLLRRDTEHPVCNTIQAGHVSQVCRGAFGA